MDPKTFPPSISQLKQWFNTHQSTILGDFFHFLSFPSISAHPEHAADTRGCATWLTDYLKAMGFQVESWESPGYPVIFATHAAKTPHRPTVLIYHHYDVQPIDPVELWKSEPFTPRHDLGEIYARGASDNKGQCFYSLTALKALLELAPALDLNIHLFIEGEEESGSGGTATAIEQHREQLKADYLLVVDFDILAENAPCVTLGMRGILTGEVICSNTRIDLHSGIHGGIALNPNRALISILATLWDDRGEVTIPHFYDAVTPLSPSELDQLDLSFDTEEYARQFGIQAYCPETLHHAVRASNWLRPTLEINGIGGGYTGPGFKTVIPAEVRAKISCRLVPHQDPEHIARLVTGFLMEKAAVFNGIGLKIDFHHGAPAYRSSPDTPIIKIATQVYEEIFNAPCPAVLCGGSVPIVVQLAEATGGQVALIGVGLSQDNIHSPNEHFSLNRLEKGFLLMARLLARL